ncbi:hypothetical protein ABIE41_000212 [Bosea sp. OAE506]|uniref:hypothetical protein n=1 Tax=Bosea sp. OAE506 TaxID=2663870 RepID=UPI00178BAC2D
MITGDAKTVLLPCYSPIDFAPAGDATAGFSGYSRWRTAARRELTRHLAEGYVVELVFVRRHEFEAWRVAHDIKDGLQARLNYVRTARVAPRRTLRLGTAGGMSLRRYVS